MRRLRLYGGIGLMRTRRIVRLPARRQIYVVEGRVVEIVVGVVIIGVIIMVRGIIEIEIIPGVIVRIGIVIVRVFVECGRKKVGKVCSRPGRQGRLNRREVGDRMEGRRFERVPRDGI